MVFLLGFACFEGHPVCSSLLQDRKEIKNIYMAHGPRGRLPSQLTDTKFGTVERAAHTKSVY